MGEALEGGGACARPGEGPPGGVEVGDRAERKGLAPAVGNPGGKGTGREAARQESSEVGTLRGGSKKPGACGFWP